MERDDLLLRAIAEGSTSSAALAGRTGLSPASVWRGLRRLTASEYVFSPVRGFYRLTASGERVLAAPGGEPADARDGRPPSTSPGALVAPSIPERDRGVSSGQASVPTDGPATVPAWLVGGGLVALGVGIIALVVALARRLAPAPPPVVPPTPAAWPSDGQIWGI
jgi:hypothetical protein